MVQFAVEYLILSFLLLIPSLKPSNYPVLCVPHYNQIVKIITLVSLQCGRHYTKGFTSITLCSPHKKPCQGDILISIS